MQKVMSKAVVRSEGQLLWRYCRAAVHFLNAIRRNADANFFVEWRAFCCVLSYRIAAAPDAP